MEFRPSVSSVRAAAAAHRARAPGRPCAATTGPDLVGAAQVLRGIAGSATAVAAAPIDVVDLEHTHIIASIGVMVLRVRVAAALVVHNALTAALRPVVVLATNGRYVDTGRRGAAHTV